MRLILIGMGAFMTFCAGAERLEAQAKPEHRILRVNGLVVEYVDRGPTEPCVVVIPGFSQYNGSQEFVNLKRELDLHYWSYVIINSPEHGKGPLLSEGRYTWGDEEPAAFLGVLDSLELWSRHDHVSLLGFSIGGKIVLTMAWLAEQDSSHRRPIESVIAVAPPETTESINAIVSGDLSDPFESQHSSALADKNTKMSLLAHMVAVDLPLSLVRHSELPASVISEIRMPVLIICSKNDWLVRSYHARNLIERAYWSSHAELGVLRTTVHAEDILHNDGEPEARALYTMIYEWISHSYDPMRQRDSSWIEPLYYTEAIGGAREISRLSYPSYFRASSGLWWTTPDYLPNPVSVDGAFSSSPVAGSGLFENGPFPSTAGLFRAAVTLGSGKGIEAGVTSVDRNVELLAGIHYPIGSVLWLRRLTYIYGLGGDPRRIVSVDAALTLLDFQLNYGRMTFDGARPAAGELDLDLPLWASGSGVYTIGVGGTAGLGRWRDHDLGARAYLIGGPRIPLLDTRLRFSVVGEIVTARHPVISLGMSFDPGEF